MMVYGDHRRRTTARALFSDLMQACPASGGIVQHGRLVAALIAAGQIAQALADEEYRRHGVERESAVATAAMGLTHRLARVVAGSWQSGFGPLARLGDFHTALDKVCDPDREIEVNEPEGYAHYGVYPEAFWTAAAEAGLGAARVVGIRSIGTSLAAIVAAGLGAGTPLSVRPTGHPFARHLCLDPVLAAQFARRAGPVAVVDEGPGLSGSSFAAVSEALEAQGLAPETIVLFPSHRGEPGAQAGATRRARWRAARRFVQTFDDIALLRPRQPWHRVEHWVADLTGPLFAPLEDISGGAWRGASDAPRSDDPPADAALERRKFRLRGERGTFLLRFSGLGQSGFERHALQQRLAASGFALPPSGWRHGFGVEAWRADLVPLAASGLSRAAILAHLARYLGLRASLAAAGRSGAAPDTLLDMAIANLGEGLGAEAAAAAGTWRPHLGRLTAIRCPVVTDNRLQPWEWLVDPSGRIVKTDAVDHHAAHDLVGCQDIAWDLAGAAVEFGLDPDETTALVADVSRRSGRRLDPDALRFDRLTYAAFQLGAARMAADRADDADRRRWTARLALYADAARDALT